MSQAARVETEAGAVFVKWAEGAAGQTYAAEAAGLAALASCAGEAGAELAVPSPLAFRAPDRGTPGVLVLPWLDRGRPTPADWRRFGGALASLHRVDAGTAYGWEADNWIGSKPQRNGWEASWPRFFGERRLRAQAETVRLRGAWDPAWDGPLERLLARLGEILPETPPRSLLHGDLWAGNAFPTAEPGDPRTGSRFALIDPAVSVGHREADLAMTELFGGFAEPFYDGYREAWPLEPGYEERREVYNLFHLINHLTHGPGYRAPVERTLRRFA